MAVLFRPSIASVIKKLGLTAFATAVVATNSICDVDAACDVV